MFTKALIGLLLVASVCRGEIYTITNLWAPEDHGILDTETDTFQWWNPGTHDEGTVYEAIGNGRLIWASEVEPWFQYEIVHMDIPDRWSGYGDIRGFMPQSIADGWGFFPVGTRENLPITCGLEYKDTVGARGMSELVNCGSQTYINGTGLGIVIVEPVHYDLRLVGDANMTMVFDSHDMLYVFQAGKYETGEPARWHEGDWTGDGLFDSNDMVAAFVSGKYEQGPAAVAAVPEPSGFVLLLVGLVFASKGRGKHDDTKR